MGLLEIQKIQIVSDYDQISRSTDQTVVQQISAQMGRLAVQ
jgi:hypothetical protein